MERLERDSSEFLIDDWKKVGKWRSTEYKVTSEHKNSRYPSSMHASMQYTRAHIIMQGVNSTFKHEEPSYQVFTTGQKNTYCTNKCY